MPSIWPSFFHDSRKSGYKTCNLCHKDISCRGNTTNLKNHLKFMHKKEFFNVLNDRSDEEESEVELSSESMTTMQSKSSDSSMHKHETPTTSQATITPYLKIKKSKEDEINQELAYFIAVDMMPYSIVEKKGFKRFVNCLNPGYTLPSRKTLSETKIPALYECTKENIKGILSEYSSSFLSFTIDCWTAVGNMPFISLTTHFITHDFKLGKYKKKFY